MKLKPVMRTDEHHQQKHESILRMIREKQIDVVFLGDSLTRRWEDNSHLWDEYFSQFNPANFGVGGDCIENVLWRIENGEIDGISPKLFSVLIGTNNLCRNTENEIVEGIMEVVRTIRLKCPESKVVVFGLLPREKDETGRECNDRIDRINRELAMRAGSGGYVYEYFGDPLMTERGSVDKDLMPDGLHLNESGYRVVGPIVRAIVERHFFPRAE
ncbi:MAG: hypothetical protein GXX08_06255 [Firmicutes bacterium]|nr:hypothetical protein [Bacillota bacterium]